VSILCVVLCSSLPRQPDGVPWRRVDCQLRFFDRPHRDGRLRRLFDREGRIRGLTRAAATEWGPDNIRVNVILPAGLTGQLAAAIDQNRELFDQAIQTMPLRRIGDTVHDIGCAVAALVGDDLQYLTGATLMLDGGANFLT
jgi:Enoyl-(Acyl carrier protein) reductase